MQMLGWEATLGATLTFSFMCVALVLPGDDAGHLENMVHASLQMVHSPTVLFSVRQYGPKCILSQQPPAAPGPHVPLQDPARWLRAWPLDLDLDLRGEPLPRGCHREAAAALRWRSGACPKSPMSLPLAVQVLTMALALLCFNIAGVYITKLQSATHRACVDATRQAVVWIHALLVGWEEFSLVELDVETKA